MITAPPVVRPGETKADAADRCERIARDLTAVAVEHESRGRVFRDRAQEYVQHAANLRGAR